MTFSAQQHEQVRIENSCVGIESDVSFIASLIVSSPFFHLIALLRRSWLRYEKETQLGDKLMLFTTKTNTTQAPI